MLLDCTLRDGGYYTNWDYSLGLLEDLINFHYKYTDIALEFGYVNLQKEKEYKGLCAESPFEYCNYLFNQFTGKSKWPVDKKVFLMINSNELIDINISQKIELIEQIRGSNFFNGIRIATENRYFNEVLGFIKLARENNLFSIINFMKIDKVSKEDIDLIIETLQKTFIDNRPNVFYLADSYGSLFMEDTKSLIRLFNKKLLDLDIELGFHAHNNKGLALANTIEAVNNGAEWFDGSWLGMGRGAGNAEIEHLILNKLLTGKDIRFQSKLASDAQNLIENHFINLKQKYKWGKNIFYDLSSTAGLHPTKCLDLINSHKLSKYSKIYSILSSGNDAIKHNKTFDYFERRFFSKYDEMIPILVYSGESSVKNISGLNFLSDSQKFFLIRINYSSILDDLKTNLLMTSSSERLTQFIAETNNSNSNLICITPSYCLNEVRIDKEFKNLISYETDSRFSYSIHFALNLLSTNGFKKVKVIGLDGKRNLSLKDKEEYKSTENIIKTFSQKLTIESLTNTPYNIKLTPIYSIMK